MPDAAHWRVQRAVDYVEQHLLEDISLEEVAISAGISLYHLHRLFSAVFGDTLKAYIRRRRLTEAAQILASGDMRIIELAIMSRFFQPGGFFQGLC